MLRGIEYPLKGLLLLPTFWSDAVRNYFYYVWLYIVIGAVYLSAIIGIFTTTGLVIFIPLLIFLAIFQVNTWTMAIMRHTLLKDQTWVARKIDERYKGEQFSNPNFFNGTIKDFTWSISMSNMLRFFVFSLLSFIPIVPQIWTICSIGWQYANAIYLPYELPDSVYWENLPQYIFFGISAAVLESVPILSGLFFTSNFLGGMLMEKKRLHS